jgi:hypothetical protein
VKKGLLWIRLISFCFLFGEELFFDYAGCL